MKRTIAENLRRDVGGGIMVYFLVTYKRRPNVGSCAYTNHLVKMHQSFLNCPRGVCSLFFVTLMK